MWFDIVKYNRNERAIELIKDIIERNPEFELKGDEVIIKPSWLDNDKSWAENIKIRMGVGNVFHKGINIDSYFIPQRDRYIDYFSFTLPIDRPFYEKDRKELYVYVHFHYYFRGEKHYTERDLCLNYRGDDGPEGVPIGDYYASFLLATKDKEQFIGLWS